jgi:hypothetical protein
MMMFASTSGWPTYIKAPVERLETKKTKGYIAMFRAHSGIEQNQLAFLCRKFIDDESQFEGVSV